MKKQHTTPVKKNTRSHSFIHTAEQASSYREEPSFTCLVCLTTRHTARSPRGGYPHDDRRTPMPPTLVAPKTKLIELVVHLLIGFKHQSKWLGPHTTRILHYEDFWIHLLILSFVKSLLIRSRSHSWRPGYIWWIRKIFFNMIFW